MLKEQAAIGERLLMSQGFRKVSVAGVEQLAAKELPHLLKIALREVLRSWWEVVVDQLSRK